ncbi:MAG: adenylate/guanylate cyclase domain-containing protein [Dehalococcoidia bacterium]|nr:adenylate/guanylate cyclase domain-containing protein [Dehalococcoidia bacterium]
MPRIRYVSGPTIELEEGETVLDASIRRGVDHRQACGGKARCSTCRIEVVEGAEHCPEPRLNERVVLAIHRLRPPVRLACQLRPDGDIAVRVLLRESEQQAPQSLAEGLAQEREVAVLFADIRNFTTFVEQHLPFDVLHLLNRYFDRMGTIVENHEGHVVSFQGDGMMTLFTAGGDEAALAAVHSGLEMLEACRGLSGYSMEHFNFEFRVGIGIDFGRAVVGQVGYYRNTHLSAIGDVVNTASRVQVLTKETGAELLVTAPVREHIGACFRIGREFTADLRGKAGQHNVYEVLGAA